MKYCPELTKEICGYLEQGFTQKDACDLSGISTETFNQWLKKPEFSDAIKVSLLKDKQFHMKKISTDKSWQSSAWWLERKFRDDFRPPTQNHGIDPEANEIVIRYK